MARKKREGQLTPLELEIMQVLWEDAPVTVQEVQQRLSERRKLAYTTVQTMLNLLHDKGKVKRTLKERAYQYSPAVTRRKVVGQTMRDIIDRLFGGSAESLVMSLVETRHLTPERLARVKKLVEKKEKGDAKD